MCGTKTRCRRRADVSGPWYSFDYTFAMETGEAKLPRPPITGKAVEGDAVAGVGRIAPIRRPP